MTKGRIVLLVISVAVALALLGGGMMVKVGAADRGGGKTRLFMQALTMIDEFYVDPIENDELLQGACEGMLAGLDSRGAFLTPEEVAEWNAESGNGTATTGLVVLKGFGIVQVVSVLSGSPADAAGIEPGDQIRRIDGLELQDRSLDQLWMLLGGTAGTKVTLEVVYPDDGFRREEIVLDRIENGWKAYDLNVQRGVAVLLVHDMSGLSPRKLASELDDLRSGGIDKILLDLRNVVEGQPRKALELAGLFLAGDAFELTDRTGKGIEVLRTGEGDPAWNGEIAILINGATAGGSEALAALLQKRLEARVFGESSYGLATEPGFFLLADGSGVLLSVSEWQVAGGGEWAGDGITPDHVVRGQGTTFADRMRNQLDTAIEAFVTDEAPPAGEDA